MPVLDGEWQAAMSELAGLLPSVIQDAGKECAEEVAKEARDLLQDFAHAPGTYSSSPAGAAPGSISEHLAGSFLVTGTDDGAMVGPTAVYAREQELGGPMRGHPYMVWRNEGGHWYRRLVVLPDRPYLKPATNRVVDSGIVSFVYIKHLEAAIALVT
jgi:phage gpG-like protein